MPIKLPNLQLVNTIILCTETLGICTIDDDKHIRIGCFNITTINEGGILLMFQSMLCIQNPGIQNADVSIVIPQSVRSM